MTNNIEYFKLQAKNLLKDYKTKCVHYFPDPYYEVMDDFHFTKKDMGLMDAQFLVAKLSGFSTWKELIHAPEERLSYIRQIWEESNCLSMTSNVFEEVKQQEKKGLEDDGLVECLHCGEKFYISECKTIQLKQKYQNGILGGEKITVCKNYPKCNGQAWDLVPIDKE